MKTETLALVAPTRIAELVVRLRMAFANPAATGEPGARRGRMSSAVTNGGRS